jgi:hypothetical protein
MQTLRLLIRAIVQRLAVQSGDPAKYDAELFDSVSAMVDEFEAAVPTGDPALREFGDTIRESLDRFSQEMAVDIAAVMPGRARQN